MLFNSFQFAAFFVVVYLLYLVLKHKWQNRMLLLASCVFYGSWNWKFLFLLFSTISVDFFCAKKIHAASDPKKRRAFLTFSLTVNLVVLGFFKYFNFFTANFQQLMAHTGIHLPIHALNIILPLGISFYTFEAISYVWDVYRGKMQPVEHYEDYALFVMYFPHLIAGPIMRAKDLLPQICKPRLLTLGLVYEGIYFFVWGLFEKVVIADKLATLADPVFAPKNAYSGGEVLLALYAFAFQIFCDFDGYSNMARGLGKMMGFDIMFNFNLPYFSTNPREYWQRWHISLSSWLRDYLYIPLGGNRNGTAAMYRNLWVTMLLGGLWHGASWNFILWGFYQGLILVVHRFLTSFNAFVKIMERCPQFLKIILFFHLICLGWLFFRAHSLHQIGLMLSGLLHMGQGFDAATFWNGLVQLIWILWFLLLMQVFQFLYKDLVFIFKRHWLIQGLVYSLLVFFIIVYAGNSGKEFIYFQF